MSPHEFTIPVHNLDAAGREFRVPVRVAWLRGALEGTDVGPVGGDGTLDVRVSKSGADVVVRGSLVAELLVACSRCLEPARVVVNETLTALAVVRGAEPVSPGADDEDDASAPQEADIIAYDGENVVLDGLIRDELLLGIPMIPLCSESCPGISHNPFPEADGGGVDPRLRPLLKLKKT
ncbi:MAG: DUF177 domain-containing protein [Polyangiaceae bacterium]|jgi:uncharacterized protein